MLNLLNGRFHNGEAQYAWEESHIERNPLVPLVWFREGSNSQLSTFLELFRKPNSQSRGGSPSRPPHRLIYFTSEIFLDIIFLQDLSFATIKYLRWCDWQADHTFELVRGRGCGCYEDWSPICQRTLEEKVGSHQLMTYIYYLSVDLPFPNTR